MENLYDLWEAFLELRASCPEAVGIGSLILMAIVLVPIKWAFAGVRQPFSEKVVGLLKLIENTPADVDPPIVLCGPNGCTKIDAKTGQVGIRSDYSHGYHDVTHTMTRAERRAVRRAARKVVRAHEDNLNTINKEINEHADTLAWSTFPWVNAAPRPVENRPALSLGRPAAVAAPRR